MGLIQNENNKLKQVQSCLLNDRHTGVPGLMRLFTQKQDNLIMKKKKQEGKSNILFTVAIGLCE